MAQALPISRLINVSVNLAPNPAQMQNISTLLILGSSNIINVVERIRNYASIADVAADFGTSAPEYLAALLWFEQAPQPTTLSIGRWAAAATPGKLIGSLVTSANQLISVWNTYTTPGFNATINGVQRAINPASFATATNLNGVASLIQTAAALLAGGTTVVWNSVYNRFELEVAGSTGVGSTVSLARASAAVGTATFSVNPANLDTLTLNGTTITFVTGAPGAGQVQIGGTLAATLANLLAYCRASADAQLVKFKYSVDTGNTIFSLEAATSGTGGNALTLAKSSTAITVSGTTLAGGLAGANDISSLLGFTVANSGAYVADGIAAESAVTAVTAFDNQFGQAWYGLTVLGGVDADSLAVAAYIEAANNKHIFGVSSQDSATLSAIATTDIAYQLKQLAYRRTAVQYSSSNAYSVCSLLGRILTTDYNGNNTVITLMYKQEPGIAPETVTATQIAALEAKNCNIFVTYNNNTAIIEKGVVSSGDFLDIITGTDWLALDIQTTVYNLLYSNTTKIPQTDAGNNVLVTGIESVCIQAVTNGLLAPGVWGVGGFGQLKQNDFLPKGFYVYAPPVALQNPADRAARASVVFQVAAKLAGAIHTANVQINVNR